MAQGMTRDEQETDVIYVCPVGSAFITTDGVGRFWFDSEEEAQEEFGDVPVVYLDVAPEDY